MWCETNHFDLIVCRLYLLLASAQCRLGLVGDDDDHDDLDIADIDSYLCLDDDDDILSH